MTREEAIEILTRYKEESEEDYYVKRAKALTMAIKALEQELVLDKIRAEIEKWHKEGTNWSDIRLMEIEDIIDKCKAESEG